MGKTRKVILWGREDLLGCSVEMLLSDCGGWDVIWLSNRQDEERLLDAIQQEEPDAVLLYIGNSENNETLPVRLIRLYPGIRIIALHQDSDDIEVYSKQKIRIHTISDLISAFES